MELHEMINSAAEKYGTVRKLAIKLGVRDVHISAAKTGKRGLPDEACARLAEILDINLGEVIAARNFAMAKDKEQRNFWRPFVRDLPRKAAAWMIGIATAATVGWMAPNDAQAIDIIKMTEKAGEALPALRYDTGNGYYVK